MADLRRRFVAEIERESGPLSPALADAFGAVPREAFVGGGFQRRDGKWATPGMPGFLQTVYSDNVLVTKLADGLPVSSSSQPSLMAIMLTALEVQPGDRVLEIGTGTGYNAALLSSLGASVTSVDVQPDVAAQARDALSLAGVQDVRLLVGDGYLDAGPDFDRVIVTVGVAGISPHWLSQSRPGLVVAPVEHAGTHPVLAVTGTADGPVTGSVICPSGFMTAAGPLTARHSTSHPAPTAALTDLEAATPPRWAEPLTSLRYRDLWYAAGIWSTRATHAALPDHRQNAVALLDSTGTGGAAILPDGSILAGGPEAGRCTEQANEIVARWESAGRPPMQAWQITLSRTPDPRYPLWTPTSWQLT
ncbi:protein-L-isoaspartate O-methyltransferase family protein [Winogradskya humida]|uniref:Protein-L-isoaspartate O-methyltransferase n=1 Tax=Winogradskya humida TaxID=113566 RepID=A0ABQ3ZPT4_9ACTN|nr:methyltransferase domain-containing protein [Actinoplanes humidus]GIE20599.1 protein-L-isoaspartate O-methyltransferase [Actinoplanes humidus]